MARISRITRKRLGELMLDEGLITDEQLAQALQVQQREGRVLGEVLVELGYAEEETIARLIAHQHGLPFIEPGQYDIPADALEVFPEAALLKYRFVPLDVFGESLLVVSSGILDAEIIAEIEDLAGKRLHVMVGTASAVRKVQVEKFHADAEHLTGLGTILLGKAEMEAHVREAVEGSGARGIDEGESDSKEKSS